MRIYLCRSVLALRASPSRRRVQIFVHDPFDLSMVEGWPDPVKGPRFNGVRMQLRIAARKDHQRKTQPECFLQHIAESPVAEPLFAEHKPNRSPSQQSSCFLQAGAKHRHHPAMSQDGRQNLTVFRIRIGDQDFKQTIHGPYFVTRTIVFHAKRSKCQNTVPSGDFVQSTRMLFGLSGSTQFVRGYVRGMGRSGIQQLIVETRAIYILRYISSVPWWR